MNAYFAVNAALSLFITLDITKKFYESNEALAQPAYQYAYMYPLT